MPFYILLYFIVFLFVSNNMLHYNGIIQLSIKPNPFIIKKDLEIVQQYKKNTGITNTSTAPIIRNLNDNSEKNGLGLYQINKNPYQELHYEIAKKLLETNIQGVEGIFVYYRGYTRISDRDGNIVLPRLDDGNIISIVITQSIQPMIIHGSVPDHFIIDHDAKYVAYVAENTEKESSLSIMKWIVKLHPSLIINRKIPFPTIIIIGDPDLFFFDNKSQPIDSSINILLPTLYRLEEHITSNYSNFALQTLQYFKQLHESNYTTQIEDQLHQGKILK
jgi:hypothetical protein